MQYSVWPNMTNDPAAVLGLARWADANDFCGVWFADHYMANSGSEEIRRGDAHECWAMLPAIATATERVRIGPLVAPTSIHHPAILANRAITIDHISNGRFVLGLGAGWQINEHRAYGIELEPPGRRVDRFEEAIQIVASLLTDDLTDFAGRHYTITGAPADPAPVQSPLPLLVGTGGPRMMRIAARHAHEWNTWGTVDGAQERHAAFVAACEAVGVDPATKRTSVQALVFLTDDAAEAEAILAGPQAARSVVGNADQLAEQFEAYAAIGFDEFIIPDTNLGATAAERRDRLERIHAEVLRA